jgi:hypothetical protein
VDYTKKTIKSQIEVDATEHLLLRIQLLVVDVRVVIKDDVDRIRIKRYLSKEMNCVHRAKN